MSGITKYQPDVARGTMGISIPIPIVSSAKPSRMMLAGRRVPAFLPASSAIAEHAERERSERQSRLHRVVLEHHLQEDRQRDHRATQRDLLEHLLRDAESEEFGLEQIGVDQRGLAFTLAAGQPVRERAHRDHADGQQRDDGLTTLLPYQDAEHDPAHAQHREARADRIDTARSGVRHVADEPDAEEHDHDDEHPRAGTRRATTDTW